MIKSVPLILRILGTARKPCWDYWPSNLVFRFSDFSKGHLNKTQTEIAVILTLPAFESYAKIKTLFKVFNPA